MRKHEIEIYQFDELSEAAKEKARDWWRECGLDGAWFESVDETAKTAARLLGFDVEKILYTGFSSQGDGAQWNGRIGFKPDCREAIRAEFPTYEGLHSIADEWHALNMQSGGFVEGYVVHSSSRYYHENAVNIHVQADGDYLDDERKEQAAEVVKNFSRWIYCNLESAYDFEQSAENIDECMRANEYEFTADGSIFQ